MHCHLEILDAIAYSSRSTVWAWSAPELKYWKTYSVGFLVRYTKFAPTKFHASYMVFETCQ